MRLYRSRQGLTKGKNKKAKRPSNSQKKVASKKAKKEQTKANAKKNRKGTKTRPELMSETITLVASWFPDSKLILVVDSLYSGKSVLSKLPTNFDLVGPVYPNATLYQPAPE